METMLKSLRHFGACDVSDALVKLKANVPFAGLLPGVRPVRPGAGTTVAPVFPVQLVHKQDSQAPTLSGDKHYIDMVPSGAFLFVSGPSVQCALFGGIMGTRAKYLGAAGIAIDGNIRDVDALEALDVPLFAKGGSTIGAGYETRPARAGEAITIHVGPHTRTIAPGDFMFADRNGVVCLPADLAPQVLKLMERLVAEDERVTEHVAQGMLVADAFKRFRL